MNAYELGYSIKSKELLNFLKNKIFRIRTIEYFQDRMRMKIILCGSEVDLFHSILINNEIEFYYYPKMVDNERMVLVQFQKMNSYQHFLIDKIYQEIFPLVKDTLI